MPATATAAIVPPVPEADEIRANAAFAALMTALSRPGTVHDLPAPALGSIVLALCDLECAVFAADPALAAIAAATGARPAAIAEADHAFLDLSGAGGLALLEQVPAGSLLYPDRGATVVAAARFGTGRRLHLAGPGIETRAEIALDGLHPGLWDLRARRGTYPLGFELFLVDGARVIGLPRSTRIEVL